MDSCGMRGDLCERGNGNAMQVDSVTVYPLLINVIIILLLKEDGVHDVGGGGRVCATAMDNGFWSLERHQVEAIC